MMNIHISKGMTLNILKVLGFKNSEWGVNNTTSCFLQIDLKVNNV